MKQDIFVENVARNGLELFKATHAIFIFYTVISFFMICSYVQHYFQRSLFHFGSVFNLSTLQIVKGILGNNV